MKICTSCAFYTPDNRGCLVGGRRGVDGLGANDSAVMRHTFCGAAGKYHVEANSNPMDVPMAIGAYVLDKVAYDAGADRRARERRG